MPFIIQYLVVAVIILCVLFLPILGGLAWSDHQRQKEQTTRQDDHMTASQTCSQIAEALRRGDPVAWLERSDVDVLASLLRGDDTSVVLWKVSTAPDMGCVYLVAVTAAP